MTTIDRVGSVRLGRQRSPATSTGENMVRYIRAGNITDRGLDLSDVFEMNFRPAEQDIYRIDENDILLVEGSGSAAHVGKPVIWHNEIPNCCFQNTVIRFRPYAVEAEYALIVFRHYLASQVFARTARGIGILHLGASRFQNLQFPLPPKEDQITIAAAVDERIAELRETQKALESALSRIVEQDDEILAQAANGTLSIQRTSSPTSEPSSVNDSQHAASMQGSSTLVRSPRSPENQNQGYSWAGTLPPGWRWVRMSDVAALQLGKMRSPKNAQGPNMRPYLRVANVLEDRIDSSDITHMDFAPDEFEKYRLEPGDVLLNDGQSPELVGRPAVYRGEPPDVAYQNHLIRFRPIGQVDPEFALLVFRHYLRASHFRDIARWTTNIATLSVKRFSTMPFPLPDIDQQRQIARDARQRLTESGDQRRTVTDSLTRLPILEDEILAQAVNGLLTPLASAPSETPAELLERLGELPREMSSRAPKTPSKASPPMPGLKLLTDVLQDAEGPLSLTQLFVLAGFDRDKPSHVEDFYVALREQLGRTIAVVQDTPENTLVELIGI
jgi:type I restriction enzyme S subunit